MCIRDRHYYIAGIKRRHRQQKDTPQQKSLLMTRNAKFLLRTVHWYTSQGWQKLNLVFMIPLNIITLFKIWRSLKEKKREKALHVDPAVDSVMDSVVRINAIAIAIYYFVEVIFRVGENRAFDGVCESIKTLADVVLFPTTFFSLDLPFLRWESYLAWNFYSVVIASGYHQLLSHIHLAFFVALFVSLAQGSIFMYF
eukprot:TRINITY_DN5813_c0_g1_i17.p1 TRINITY_DN5813_c0_g1~~TRINITY_DN5813_c0_g1_i17.p1  ORF type:complete len:197 (+),score=13.32 TRINITY_DN5813_c0_g1_i17:65-655(+)